MATYAHRQATTSQRAPTGGARACRASWTAADDESLRSTVRTSPTKSWIEISAIAFPRGQHDHAECQERWKTLSKPSSVKGPWSAEEDADLIRLVNELGPEKWVVIANRLQTRTGKQCRERWHNHLDPRVNKAPFTPDEDELIFALYNKIGPKWAEMSKRLPGRPDNAIKNHYNTSLQRNRRRGNSASSVRSTHSSPDSAMSAGSLSRFSPYARSFRSDSTSNSSATSLRSASSSKANSPSLSPVSYTHPLPPDVTPRDLNREFFEHNQFVHPVTGQSMFSPVVDQRWNEGMSMSSAMMAPSLSAASYTSADCFEQPHAPSMLLSDSAHSHHGYGTYAASPLEHTFSTESHADSSAAVSPSGIHPAHGIDYFGMHHGHHGEGSFSPHDSPHSAMAVLPSLQGMNLSSHPMSAAGSAMSHSVSAQSHHSQPQFHYADHGSQVPTYMGTYPWSTPSEFTSYTYYEGRELPGLGHGHGDEAVPSSDEGVGSLGLALGPVANGCVAGESVSPSPQTSSA